MTRQEQLKKEWEAFESSQRLSAEQLAEVKKVYITTNNGFIKYNFNDGTTCMVKISDKNFPEIKARFWTDSILDTLRKLVKKECPQAEVHDLN